MRDFAGSVLTALAQRHLKRRLFIWCEARNATTGDPEPVGFWDDIGNVEVNGRTYFGSGHVVKVDKIAAKSSLTIPSLTITFSGLAPEAIAVVRENAISQAPIEVLLGIFDVDTGALLDTLYLLFKGFVDSVTVETPEAGGLSNIIFTCESISRALTIKSTETRSPSSQEERDPDDRFYEYTGSQRERTLYFGGRDPNASRKGKNK